MRREAWLAWVSLALGCGFDNTTTGTPRAGSGGASAASASAASGTSASGSGGAASSATASSATASSAQSSSQATSDAAVATAQSSSTGMVNPCGNCALDPGEQCDDCNTVDGDGCSSTCQLEGDGNSCPTNEVIKLDASIVLAGDTTGMKHITNTQCGGTTAGDLVFEVLPQKTGTIHIELATPANFDRILSVQDGCAYPWNTQVVYTCVDKKQQLFAVLDGQMDKPFYVVVDGHNGSTGSFQLSISY